MHRGAARAGAGPDRRREPGPGDLLHRDLTAARIGAGWVDLTHVPTQSGSCCTAFVMDLFSRPIVG